MTGEPEQDVRGISVARIIQVTVGLSIAGAAVGGALGALLVVLLSVSVSEFRFLGEPVRMGTTFGAAVGAVLSPIAAWTLMRDVPIWRAIAETAVGTLVGAAIGLIFQPRYPVVWLAPPLLGVAGFVAAGARLRLASRRRARALSAHAPPSATRIGDEG